MLSLKKNNFLKKIYNLELQNNQIYLINRWKNCFTLLIEKTYYLIYNIKSLTTLNDFFFIINQPLCYFHISNNIKNINFNFLETFGFFKIKYFAWQKNILLIKNININLECPLIIILEKKNQKKKINLTPFFFFIGLFILQQHLILNHIIKGKIFFSPNYNKNFTTIQTNNHILYDNSFFFKITKKKNIYNQHLNYSKNFNEFIYILYTVKITANNTQYNTKTLNFLTQNIIFIDTLNQQSKNSYKLFNKMLNNFRFENCINSLINKSFFIDYKTNFYETKGLFLTNFLEIIQQINVFVFKPRLDNYFIFQKKFLNNFDITFFKIIIKNYYKLLLNINFNNTIAIQIIKNNYKFQNEQIYTYNVMLNFLKNL